MGSIAFHHVGRCTLLSFINNVSIAFHILCTLLIIHLLRMFPLHFIVYMYMYLSSFIYGYFQRGCVAFHKVDMSSLFSFILSKCALARHSVVLTKTQIHFIDLWISVNMANLSVYVKNQSRALNRENCIQIILSGNEKQYFVALLPPSSIVDCLHHFFSVGRHSTPKKIIVNGIL